MGALAGLQGRVLLPAFSSYLAVFPPWNYILVTVAVFGSASMGLVYFKGAWFTPCCVCHCGCVWICRHGALSIKLPPFFPAVSIVAAIGSRCIWLTFSKGAACSSCFVCHCGCTWTRRHAPRLLQMRLPLCPAANTIFATMKLCNHEAPHLLITILWQLEERLVTKEPVDFCGPCQGHVC